MQPYQYKPLPSSSSIRILILHPAADTSSALECDIITNDRLKILQGPDNKTFDAVSYVWGNGTHDIPMYCKAEGTYVYISAVVDDMLRSLRKGHKETRLWVDALCLNQKDNHEKSIQVQQMGQIYHMADKVHIWLGPAEATTPLTFAFLRTLVAKFEPLPGQAKYPTTRTVLQTFEEIFQHRNIQPVLALLQNSWFTRRWTLQESFLARDAIVRCGTSKISWYWFTQGLNIVRKRSPKLQDIQNDTSALYALNVLEILQKPEDLLSLLWTLHMSQCSDHRDRIYSLLGFARNMKTVTPNAGTVNSKLQAGITSNRELPIPNYTLSADTVYREFAEHCVSTDRFFDILLHIDAFGPLSDVNPKWPSWVPNWTRARDRKLNSPTATSRIMPPFVCSERSHNGYLVYPIEFIYRQPTIYSAGNDHGLVIYGKFIHKVVKGCDTWPGGNDSDRLVEYLTHWVHEEIIQHSPYQKLDIFTMAREVEVRLFLLITGSEFFGYAKHISSLKGIHIRPRDWWFRRETGKIPDSSPWFSKCQVFANLVYTIAQGRHSYTSEQVRPKEHLDESYRSNPPPTAESRQELSDLLDDVSRMMREGKKRLITTSNDLEGFVDERTERRDWIAPDEVRMGDVIADITHCGRIGTLLRPIGSHSELRVRPRFQLIGIAWSIDGFHRHKSAIIRSQELLII